ncbi:MAG: protein kinase [Planctomycetes bacterium]|nr:protein kinase [Planctomycetota bacterium]
MFCMFCGQKLKEGSSSPHIDTRTYTFTPQEAPELSGQPDATGTHDTSVDPAIEPAPAEVGGYRLVRKIGAGGMGTVYEAEAPGGTHVAVKLLSSRLAANPASVERFRQEGRLASQLAHPRCVFVLAADTENGRPYIVMELMPGRTLKDLVDERGPLAPHDAIVRTLDVIDGLAEAHRVGMIHRDVKPSNCFLTADDRVKVGDFGLSKSLAGGRATSLTQTGAFLGTVLFASPEQIRGEPVDYSSDVYSVAATLYFLLCGGAPFQHENAAAVLARVVSEAPPRVCARRKDVPERLDRIVARGLERDRSRRWQSLDDLREALCDLLPERQRPARPRALVGAYLIDRVACGMLAGPLEVLRLWAAGREHVHVEPFQIHWTSVFVMFTYFAVCEGRFGATPGKWLLGLRVSRAGGTGPPGVGRALVRTVAFHAMIAGMFFVPEELVQLLGPKVGGLFGALAFICCAAAMLVQVRKKYGYRGLHDFASGCHVTQKPFPVRKLRLNVAKPTPLDAVLPPTTDPLPDVGGFVVHGRLTAEPTGEQVWIAEDRELGRKVLLWLRPWGGPAHNADPARPTRLRRLGAGSVEWAGAAYDWTAFAAPLGGPLAETVRPGRPLPWADARYVLEQLAEEFRAAEADGSVPRRLALDHIWVEPNGRVQVLDFPLCAARYRSNTPLAVLREAASLTIEGRPRSTGGAVVAPIPAHALAVLDHLFAFEVTIAEFQKELAETHAHRSEVTPAVRAGHLSLQAVGLAVPLGLLFAATFTMSVWLAYGADWEAEQAKQTAAVLADPARRAKLSENSTRALDAALNSPRLSVRVNELVVRTQTEADTRHAALLVPQRRLLEAVEQAAPKRPREVGSPEAVRAVVEWAGAPAGSPAGRAPAPWREDATPLIVLYGTILLGMVLLAVVLRGGISLMLAGIAVVRADGRPAYRRQCAARAVLVWFPVLGLLFGSATVQAFAPQDVYLALGLWLVAVVLLPVYVFLALRYPTRPPHDRITGTFLVPM